MQFIKSALSAILLGACVYVLTMVVTGMLAWHGASETQPLRAAQPNEVVAGATDTTVAAVLDVPEYVARGEQFQYSIARSTYGGAGVQAVHLTFDDDTVLEYTSGHAPASGTHVFHDPGRHVVTLTIIDAGGVSHVDTCAVFVGDPHTYPLQQGPTVRV